MAHHNIPQQLPNNMGREQQEQHWPPAFYITANSNSEGSNLARHLQQQSSPDQTRSPPRAAQDNHMLMQHRLLYMKKMSGAAVLPDSQGFGVATASSPGYNESNSIAVSENFGSSRAEMPYAFAPQIQQMRPLLVQPSQFQANNPGLQRMLTFDSNNSSRSNSMSWPHTMVSPTGIVQSVNGVPAGVIISPTVGSQGGSGSFFSRVGSEVVNRLPLQQRSASWSPQSHHASAFCCQQTLPGRSSEISSSSGVELTNRSLLSSSSVVSSQLVATNETTSRSNVVAVATLTTGDRCQVSLLSLDDLTSPGNVALQRLNVFSPASASDDDSNDLFVSPLVPIKVESTSSDNKEQEEKSMTVQPAVEKALNNHVHQDLSSNRQKSCESLVERQRLPSDTSCLADDGTGLHKNSYNPSGEMTSRDSYNPVSETVSVNTSSSSAQMQVGIAKTPTVTAKDSSWLPSFGVFASPTPDHKVNVPTKNKSDSSDAGELSLQQRPFSPSAEDLSNSSSNSYGTDKWPSSSPLSAAATSTNAFNKANTQLASSQATASSSPFPLEFHGTMVSEEGSSNASKMADTTQGSSRDVYCCHICTFVGTTSEMFKEHMSTHFEHRCPNCDYTSRTEGRLKKHIKDFHSADSINAPREPGRPKILRCRQCDFMSQTKTEFWQHARTHIKMDKVLQCPRCPFVTEYKHHLEYHLRNHFGSKPFQCPKCNYACVNKSMLNSHMKSHTNVYQYRCAECSYATKYCHSLKLHLQKYCHRPAVVLNPDGSLPIDGSGSFEVAAKRGPPKGTPKSKRHTSLPPLVGVGMGSGNSPSPPAVASDVPAMIATTPTTSFAALLIKNDWASAAAAAAAAGVGDPTPMPPLVPLHTAAAEHLASNWQQKQQQQQQAPWLPTCSFCHNKFTDHQQLLRHIVQHHAAENRDILAMIGVSADSLLDTADNSSKTPPHQLCSASLQPGSDGSPVRGLRDSWPKSTPVSFHTLAGTAYWTAKQARPSNSGSEGSIMADGDHSNKEDEMPRSKSMPAMLVTEEISNEVTTTKQMGERPLDLTKRVEVTSSEFANASYWKTSSSSAAYDQDSSSYEQHIAIESSSSLLGDEANMIDPQNSSQSGCNSPAHKRSRKGKAYKLDTLMRLQPDRTNSQSSVSSETSSSSDGALGQPLPTSRRPSISPTLQAHASTVGVNQFRDEYALPTANQSADSECGNITSDTFDDYTQFHQRQTQEQRSPPNLADIPNVAARQMDLASYNPAILTNNRGPSVTDSQIVARRGSSTSVLDMPSISGMNFECQHCQIVFRDYVMYMMHKGYHGYQHPFTCNMCGFRAEDRLEFFLHIARVAHE